MPLHALVVHAAVVFGPLAALTALVYAAVPRWRDRFRLPMVGLAVVGTLSVIAAYVSGSDLLENNPALVQKRFVPTHQGRAELLLWLVLFVLCWPLALVALLLYPLFWLLTLPFRLVGVVFDGVFELLRAILLLPARLLGARPAR